MSDERSFERFVADHVAGAAGQVPLPDDFYQDIHAFASRTRQRPEWLALIKEPPMRLSNRVAVGSPMARISATAVAGLALAVVLAGGVFAASPSPEVQVGGSPIPSAAPSPTADPMAPAYVTGNLRGNDDWYPGVVTIVDGVLQRRGDSESLMVTSSDPRVGGVWRYYENRDEYQGTDVVAGSSWTEIRGDDGAWVGIGTGSGRFETLVLAGEGAYAGLNAYVTIDWSTPGRPFTGIIIAGEAPEPPPAPSSAP